VTLHFDGKRAWQQTADVVALGVRAPGTDGHQRAVDLIVARLKALGLNPRQQQFTARTPDGSMPMVNVLATIPATEPGTGTVMVAAHYDTKIFKDFTFVGANDGGSGTGALLELGRALLAAPRRTMDVTLVFLDGEEAFRDWSNTDSLYGSRFLARSMSDDGSLRSVKAFILMDMIGDADLLIVKDGHSTPWLRDLVWRTAAQLGFAQHFGSDTMAVEDDHLPFVKRGVPGVLLIDFSYGLRGTNGYWHTAADTMDKISADSLGRVGLVVEAVVLQLIAKQ